MPVEIVAILHSFFNKVKEDPRIGTSHISLFMVLFYWYIKNGEHPVYFFGPVLQDQAKLSRRTYYQVLRELQEYGYIKYVPSFNPALGSIVYLKI
jgi:hypothetical protein